MNFNLIKYIIVRLGFPQGGKHEKLETCSGVNNMSNTYKGHESGVRCLITTFNSCSRGSETSGLWRKLHSYTYPHRHIHRIRIIIK